MTHAEKNALRRAHAAISRLLHESFYDSRTGAVMEPRHFEGRRRGPQTNAGERVEKDWATFMDYLEKALKRAVASGEYDWLMEEYEGQVGTRSDIVEANLMAMRDIASWVDAMNGFYADKYAEFLDSGEPFEEDELGDWETLKGIARSIKDDQPYGEKAEYEIYPLLDVLDANPGIFAAAPQSPGLDTLKNMVRHLKRDHYCVDEGVTADDIPEDWYRGAAL